MKYLFYKLDVLRAEAFQRWYEPQAWHHTHIPAQLHSPSWGRACPLLHSPGQTGSISWLWPQQLPHPDSTSNSTAWQDTGFCYRPLWEIITEQFVPSDAAKSIQLINAPLRATERTWHSRARQQPVCLQLHTAVLCIYSFSVLAGRDQPCLTHLPFTSWCWSYSFEQACNYNPVVFFHILSVYSSFYFCYHHSVPDLPLPLCVLLFYRSIQWQKESTHWYYQALRLYQP